MVASAWGVSCQPAGTRLSAGWSTGLLPVIGTFGRRTGWVRGLRDVCAGEPVGCSPVVTHSAGFARDVATWRFYQDLAARWSTQAVVNDEYAARCSLGTCAELFRLLAVLARARSQRLQAIADHMCVLAARVPGEVDRPRRPTYR